MFLMYDTKLYMMWLRTWSLGNVKYLFVAEGIFVFWFGA